MGGGRHWLSREQRRWGSQIRSREQSRGLRGVITLFIGKVEIQLILFKDLIIRSYRASFPQHRIQRRRATSNHQHRSRVERIRTLIPRLRRRQRNGVGAGSTDSCIGCGSREDREGKDP
jgi:hypothetical protein